MDAKKQLLDKLKKDILQWQGFKPQPIGKSNAVGLGGIESVFPNGVFPKGVIHEFIAVEIEHLAACDGFIGGVLSSLMKEGAPCVWVSKSRKLFPLSLSAFNVNPDRIFFMDAKNEKDLLWIVEEALKCQGLAAVVADVVDLDITASRRLQLASEQSGVTGFIIRKDGSKKASTIATARWLISPAPSYSGDELPGIGFPRWNVELLKVRNGNLGKWTLEWMADEFVEVIPEKQTAIYQQRQIG